MNFQFYPTPRPLANRMWSMFKSRNFERVLEPHGGDGDLADARPFSVDYSDRKHIPIDCCEIDMTHHATLREKNYQIVGMDFLQLGSGSIYSHIIGNPPFAEGAAHLMHAWNILWEGEIVFVLNAETIRNPCTRERRQLVQLIKDHGSFEFVIGQFAIDEAERRTDVEIALVWLHKKVNVASDIFGNLLDDLKVDSTDQDDVAAQFEERREVMLPTTMIENLVVAFNAANKSMHESVLAESKARYYAAILGETMASRCHDGPKAAPQQAIEFVRKTVMKRYLELKDRAWAGVLRSTDVTSRLSSQAQKRIESEFADIKQLEFTTTNIYGFLLGLCDSAGKIQQEMCCDVFDLFTRYHSDNTNFYMGWKSNSKHRTAGMRLKSTRFILPGHTIASYQNSLPWDSQRTLSDIDKVFAMLDGKNMPDVSLVQVFADSFGSLKNGARVSSSYFDVRYYPGIGTIHFFPRGQDMVDRLNRMVGRMRQWLPPEGECVSDAFWLQYDKAERFDRELRKEVTSAAGSRFCDNPFNALGRDAERNAEAMQKIGDAMSTVLGRHGIEVDTMLDAPESQKQLLLAA